VAYSLHQSPYGWGLLPQDYLAFRTQRARWAGGAVQIVKKHWRRFLPGQSQLDHDQKREFAFGWLSWFGVEIVAVAAALLNLIWLPFVVFQVVAIPDPLLLLPSVAAFLVSLLHFVSAYRTRVAVPYRQMLGAMVVFMSVQWTVASAAFKAAFPTRKTYFHRTRKGRGRYRPRALYDDARSRAGFAAGRGWHHGVCDQFLPAVRNRFVRLDPDHPEPALFVGRGNGGVRALQRSRE
jgi:cellulose synthase/poly-beta-1,6-N-acetylglucosamine synthase-like glycosyltransferase